ncbi:hypothetical protein RCL_jg11559.t1 [Rhizophagus clarus]|uniref:Integrase catalytic domain-containing protein n=1 Tax=Rhizophagus clarus TaxID=94130 RepID=A0A8H3LAC4_9GLOM|nr:hypothetical protein RCL_jg11559.t1 [Rhizophagus clarus]
MGEPVIYIDPQKARELDQIIAKQTPTINIDLQKAHNLDQHLALQKLYYHPEGLYQNVKGLWDACKKAGYSFLFIDPNTVHQCDLIEIPYDEDVDTNLLDDGPIYYYVLLDIDCATRYKDFIFLTSKSSKEVAEAFKSIYDNPDKPLNWPRKLQCDKAHFRHTSFAMIDNYAGHFSRRVFKNQYLVKFLLSTGKRCRECERFARRIVDNMNDSLTRLIGMSPNDATKLERIYSKPSVKYNRPIGINEPQLPKGTTIQFLLAPEEWENDLFERHRITDSTWSPSLHKIWRIVVGKNSPTYFILFR